MFTITFTIHSEDKARIKLPRDMEDAKGLGRALSNYTDEYFTQVLLGFVVIYILYPFHKVLVLFFWIFFYSKFMHCRELEFYFGLI